MSWAEEDWTVGLSGRALQKVKELQVHQERSSREAKQKQLQLDNLQVALSKQTAKYEEVRGEVQALQRELQGVRDAAQAEMCARERLSQDLQTKQALVCSLEGQLDAARTLTHTLTQEVKRLEAELEKLQNSSRAGDTSLYSTPCWNMTSPWEDSGGRKEERSGPRRATESREQHVRQQLQFSDSPKSPFPRQQQSRGTPRHQHHHHPSDQSDAFSSPSAMFPWERDDPRPAAARGRSAPSPHTPSADVTIRGREKQQGDCGTGEDPRGPTDSRVSELVGRVSALEAELHAEAARLRTNQEQLGQSRKELASRELSLQKARDELSLAHTRIAQERDRVSGAEQKLRQLQEELKCQRQNAESSRLQHQQRTRELEKQHQRDLLEQQKERQALERQQQQEVNKLNQEIQQARALYNTLQSQADKLSLQKQTLDRELESLKEKLKWTEGQLVESQKTEAQTQAKLMEALREAEGVAVTLEQTRRREKALEDEGKRLAQEKADALHLLKELQDQKASPAPLPPAVQFTPVAQSFTPAASSPHASRTSAHSRKPSANHAERGREEEGGERVRAPATPKYPSEREPGEGIDSEHIAANGAEDSERPRRAGRERSRGEEEEEEARKSGTGEDDGVACDGTAFSDRDGRAGGSEGTGGDLGRENAALRSELRDVRDELQRRLEDLEGQRRAEAEARARLKQLSRKHASQATEREEREKEKTREREEEDRARKAELERERAETERLRKALASLEATVKRGGRTEESREDEGRTTATEDRESEMVELNIQLKKQLAEVKAQLALEREEREREKEESERKKGTMNKGNDLNIKLAELEAELEVLRNRGKEGLFREKIEEASSSIAYLSLGDNKLDLDIIGFDNKLLPSPELHRLFCESTNQRNTAVSQVTADFIQEEKTLEEILKLPSEHPTAGGQTGQPASVPEETTLENHLDGCLPSDRLEVPIELQKEELATLDLAKEVDRLRRENAREAGRTRQCQAKLEALQSQVTCQTKQLTLAFSNQSRHIADLLAEVQEKEGALLRQGEELQRAQQDLAALRTEAERSQKEEEEEEEVEEKRLDGGEKMTLKEQMDGEKKDLESPQDDGPEGQTVISLVTSAVTEGASSAVTNAETETAYITKPLATASKTCPKALSEQRHDVERFRSSAPPQDSVDSRGVQTGRLSAHSKIISNPDVTRQSDTKKGDGGSGGAAGVAAELLSLKQENQQLRRRLEALTVSDTTGSAVRPALRAVGENQSTERSVREGYEAGALSGDERSCAAGATSDVRIERQEAKRPGEGGRGERGRRGGETEESATGTTGGSGKASQPQSAHLDQQVAALQAQLQALSEENRKQAEELLIWRLASQPDLGLDPVLTQTDGHSDIQDQPRKVFSDLEADAQSRTSQAQAQAPRLGIKEPSTRGVGQNPGTVTVVREDELLLSCSSSRLYGRTLTSSLHHRNCPEPKSPQPSKKPSAPQDLIQEMAVIDKESEKENLEGSYTKPSKSKSAQHKEKRHSDTIQRVLDETTHQHVAKDPHTLSGPLTKAPDSHKDNPETKRGAPRAVERISTTEDSSARASYGTKRSAGTQTEQDTTINDLTRSPELRDAGTQTEDEEEEEEALAESPPVSRPELEAGDKLLFSGAFPIPADPARLAERILRNRSQLSAAFDDTEYEPYGLPEVVMKGFADIPSGEACPYIVRRGLLGTAAVPLPQREAGLEEETD